MSNRKLLAGKFVWFELVTRETKQAQMFYGEVLGWKTVPFPMGTFTYEMIYAGDTMIGGYAPPNTEGQPAHWISSVSVPDVDAAARAASANGGKVIKPPQDIPGVGRRARITDPQGAELCVFNSLNGDPADEPGLVGGWMWNELHTSDAAKAVAFYDKVVGYSHRSMDMGPAGGVYHILGQGGVDRAGVTEHLDGAAPHWLPYVHVDDADAAIARAKRLGASIPVSPMDIPGIGRFGVLRDPVGGVLAVMKPAPMEKDIARG